MPASPPPLRKKSRLSGFLKAWFLFTACVAVLVVGYFPVEKYRARVAWQRYEKEAKARGVKLEYTDFTPPEVPEGENFASVPIFEEAFRAAEAGQPISNPFKLTAPGNGKLPAFDDAAKQQFIDLAAWRKCFAESKLVLAAGPNPATEVLAALETFPLDELSTASTRPHCRFPVQWEKGFPPLPHVEILDRAAQLYTLRLSAHLALGKSAAAYEDFQQALRLVAVTSREPSLLMGVIRQANVARLENAVWGGLARGQWTDQEMQRIEADLASLDWLKDWHFTMQSERGGANRMLDILIENPHQLSELRSAASVYPRGWLYRSKTRMNQFFDETALRVDASARRFDPARTAPSSPAEIGGFFTRFTYIAFGMITPVLEGIDTRFVQAATFTDQTRIACALERFRLARGAYPETLTELAPAFIPAVPVEIMNGESYRYRRTDDGKFLLYSVASNLRDDHGVPAPGLSAQKQPDWVWRYP